MIAAEEIIKRFQFYGMQVDEEQAGRLDFFAELLAEWNRKINLTAISKPDEVLNKHFIDSALLGKCVNFQRGVRLVDVGCGAGFPSTPLMILHPEIQVTQVESISKKAMFLEKAKETLRLSVEIVNERAEVLARKEGYREAYDFATARAVCSLNKLAEYCLPFLKVGGRMVAMKGANAEEELAQARNAIKLLGGDAEDIKRFELPGGEERKLVLVKKISQISTKYPRNSSRISKNPL